MAREKFAFDDRRLFDWILQVDARSSKRVKYRKLIGWLLVDLTVAVVIFSLLLYRPARYAPVELNSPAGREARISPYLTRLYSQYYNSAQRREAFELVIYDKEINEALAMYNFQIQSEGIWLSSPTVLFVPSSIVFMGTANIKGAEFIVTIAIEPRLDQQGLLDMEITKVKIGAMNVTPIAKMIAKKMYEDRLELEPVNIEDWRTWLAAALLNGEPFVPIFPAEDKKVRLKEITIRQGQLKLQMVPAS